MWFDSQVETYQTTPINSAFAGCSLHTLLHEPVKRFIRLNFATHPPHIPNQQSKIHPTFLTKKCRYHSPISSLSIANPCPASHARTCSAAGQ
jgi:hypothetical protein